MHRILASLSQHSVADCAEAGTRDRGCKQRIAGRGWVGEMDAGNRFAMSERIAGSIWREITTVAAMGKEEKDRRRALRVKVCCFARRPLFGGVI